MFTCPNCENETSRLIAAKDGLKCPDCYRQITYSPTYLHTKAGLKREAKNLTTVAKKHIWQRTIGQDNKVVHKSNPNRIWSW